MGLKSRIVGLVGASALILGGAVGIAVPAQAAPALYNWYVGCNAGSTALVLYDNSVTRTGNTGSMTAAVGDSVRIYNYTGSPNIGCQGAPLMGYNLDFGINSTWYITNYSNPYATLVFSSGDSSISVRAYAGTPANTYTVTVSGTGGGGGGSSSSSSTVPAAPADLLQQVGVPADGSCASITDTSLNWAGVASGGWGISWAQWMNGGKGGGVCSRALFYNLNLAKWGVRA